MNLMLLSLLQKDAVEAECWVAWVRRREWGQERYEERERAMLEAMERKEEEEYTLRGKSDVITRVHAEQVEVAQCHSAALQGKYFSLLPKIIATIWVSLPRVQISPVYLHKLLHSPISPVLLSTTHPSV